MPKVSIITPTCNRHELLKKSISSVLAQTYKDWEMIIVDDCPEKPAEEIVRKFGDRRLKYIKHERNKGGAAARNTGIRTSQGQFIAFIDDDDEWLPEKLQIQMQLFENTPPEIGFCFSSGIVVTDQGEFFKDVPEGLGDYHERALKNFHGFLGITLIIKKAVLEDIGLWDESFPSHQEIELILRITRKYKGLGINKPLTSSPFTINHDHIGSNLKKRIAGRQMIIKKHYDEFKKYPGILASHYFQIALWCRDDKQVMQAKDFFKKAWRTNFQLVYFIHYLISDIKLVLKKINISIKLIFGGKTDLFFYKMLKKLGIKNLLPPLPNSLIIEPANFCNLKCPLCPTGSGRLAKCRPARLMTFDEYRNIIDQAEGYVTKIVLFNLGEPFLNKETPKMIKYAVEAKMYVKISTNAVLLDDKTLCEEIVKSGLQHLIVSLDGADQETLEKYRVGSDFDKVIRALNYIKEAKRYLGLKMPRVELQFLVMKHNEHQKEQMAEISKKYEVDIFSAKTLCLYDVPDFQEAAKKFLPSDALFSRYGVASDGQFVQKGEILNHCRQVLSSMVINTDGTVVPCCYDLYNKHVLGNVFEESLKKIWKGQKYKAFRAQIKKDRKQIKICNTCPEERVEFLSEKKKIN